MNRQVSAYTPFGCPINIYSVACEAIIYLFEISWHDIWLFANNLLIFDRSLLKYSLGFLLRYNLRDCIGYHDIMYL